MRGLILALAPLGFTLASINFAHGEQPLSATEVDARVTKLLDQLTLPEKMELVAGDANDRSTTVAIPRLGIPKLMMSDGGVNRPAKWCVFPSMIALAATWDRELAAKNGTACGLEDRAEGIHIHLYPGVNISRVPICGRNWEYFEDEGVAATVKHYAGNNQETYRNKESDEVDERTLQEIYLPAFRRAVQEGHSSAVMCAYNRINGTYCSENTHLLVDILRDEFGFKGLLMSDWGAVHSIKGLGHGLDLDMPDAGKFLGPEAIQGALADGSLTMDELNESVRHFLTLIVSKGFLDRPQKRADLPLDSPASSRLALDVAREAIVLLKNQDGTLPLHRSAIHKIAVFGGIAVQTPILGWGSGLFHAFHQVDFLDGIRKAAGAGIDVSYTPTAAPQQEGDATPTEVSAAKGADFAIVCVGRHEREGADTTFAVAPDQARLINDVCAANPHTIVVVQSGAGMEMASWLSESLAVLESWFAGQEGGTALGEILFGDVNPSGHLPVTFERRLEDYPCMANAPATYPGVKAPGEAYPKVAYSEGIFVGYRGTDQAGRTPLFPFGYGLSYTTFAYKNLQVKTDPTGSNLDVTVQFEVTNTGSMAGAAVSQVYVGEPHPSAPRPHKELKGYVRTMLAPNETRTVTVNLDRDSFVFYDVTSKSWKVDRGSFDILVGDSSRELPLKSSINL
jgi:beta-glucosidase